MNKVLGIFALLLLFGSGTVLPTQAQPEHPTPSATAAGHAAPDSSQEHAEGEEHGTLSGLLWPTLNFAVLVGLLWWLLKEPAANYLRDRHNAIRQDLVEAAKVKAAATAQLAELDQKLQALPAEIDALRERATREIAAEEQRIAAMATAERERLLEQTRREIDLQLRLAKRALVEHTAGLAVQLAGARLQQQITPEDQSRLVDRYLDQVQSTTARRTTTRAEN